jgi:uncharacterized protein
MIAARIFLSFTLTLLAAMVLAAVLSPWVQMLLTPLQVFPLHRVFSRLTMIGVIGLTAWLLIRMRLGTRAVLGFSVPRGQFFKEVGTGWLAGIALMSVALLPLFYLDVRVWKDADSLAKINLFALCLRWLFSGLLVALIEETFFRGALQGALQRAGSWKAGLLLVPLLYSAVHFLGRATNIPSDQVNAMSGFVALQGFFGGYQHFGHIAEAFLCLYCVGVLLALVRLRWGSIAACIGLHAGFVAVIGVFRKLSIVNPHSSWQFLVGSYDGLLGIWITLLTVMSCVAIYRRRSA